LEVERPDGTDPAGVRAERRILTGREHTATAIEIGIDADLPAAFVHDRRIDAVVESAAIEVCHWATGGKLATAEIVTLIEGDAVGSSGCCGYRQDPADQ
jgi:hypothetical protein